MKIDRAHLAIVDVCPKDKDTARSVLTHLLLERLEGSSGRLVAADGFFLVAVPVTLDPDDVPGMVHPEALKMAARDCPRREGTVTVYVLEDIVRSVGGACFPRTRGLGAFDRYPDLNRVIPRHAHTKAAARTGAQTAINPEYLIKAHKALGGDGTVLWPTGPTSPIVVTPVISNGERSLKGPDFEANGMPKLPFAVVMPMAMPSIEKSRDSVA